MLNISNYISNNLSESEILLFATWIFIAIVYIHHVFKTISNLGVKVYNVYKLYYFVPNDCEKQYLLTHHKNKTQIDFQNDIRQIADKYGYAFLGEQESWIGISNWIEFVYTKLTSPEFGYYTFKTIDATYSGEDIIISDKDLSNSKLLMNDDFLNKICLYNQRYDIFLNGNKPHED